MSASQPLGTAAKELIVATPSSSKAQSHRDFVGSAIGIVVFLGGVLLLMLVFKLAYDMFTIPPATAIGTDKGKLDLNSAGVSLGSILLRILLLLVMGLMGSGIANRGISLYTHSRGIKVRIEDH